MFRTINNFLLSSKVVSLCAFVLFWEDDIGDDEEVLLMVPG